MTSAADPATGETEEPLRVWYWRGVRRCLSVPAAILMGAFVGFAGLARDAGFDMAQTVVMAGVIWALPSCVVLIGAVQAGATLLGAALAVTISAVRLMPMVMALVPIMRSERTRRLDLYLLSHCVAVTSWVMAMTELPNLPRHARVAYYAGLGPTLIAMAMVVTAFAYVAAAALPPVLNAALVFLMPVYFAISLWGAARASADRLALVLGAVTAPGFHALDPQLFLMWTGLFAGTVAYAAGRLIERRRRSGAAHPAPGEGEAP